MELIGYVNLSNTEDYQAIYFSQLYGTFFGIYAKFTATLEANKYTIEKTDFKLINYKGLLNLGITDIAAPIYPVQDNQDYVAFVIQVQALGGRLEYSISNGFEVSKTGAILHVERRAKKMYPGDVRLQNGVFDEEYYYREGIADINGELGEGRLPLPAKWDDPIDVIDIKNGTKCPRSKCHII